MPIRTATAIAVLSLKGFDDDVVKIIEGDVVKIKGRKLKIE